MKTITQIKASGHEFPTGEKEVAMDFDLESLQLRRRISDLVDEIATLREATKDKEALEEFVVQLREANQNLVLATVNAQTMKDEADAANRRQTEFLAMLAMN